MPDEFISYISQYGYLAIFLFVFLQEVGAPTPFPNELVLIFSGYLVFSGILRAPMILLTICSADLLAASILYGAFCFFGNWMLNGHLRWLPISKQNIEKHAKRIHKHGFGGFFFGRLSPFIRGYVAVICGLSHLSIRKYAAIILPTTAIWGSFYILTGYLLGPYWNYVQTHIESLKYALMLIPAGFLLWILIRFIYNKMNGKRITKSLPPHGRDQSTKALSIL